MGGRDSDPLQRFDRCGADPAVPAKPVAGFGLLLGNKVYRWGCDGVYGVRLREVQIDKEHICLSFGADGEMLRVELLHGLADRQSAMEIAQKIWHETGVRAEISDW